MTGSPSFHFALSPSGAERWAIGRVRSGQPLRSLARQSSASRSSVNRSSAQRSSGHRSSAQQGATLVEIIVATGVISLLLALGIPRIDQLTARVRLDSAANEVAVILRWARQQAAMRGHNVGLKFYPSARGPTTYGLYTDGDFDGVRTADIRSGTDRELVPPRALQQLGQDIHFGIPLDSRGRPPRAPNSRRRITRPQDPIRFNRSDIASFGRSGTATPGTLYLTDGRRALAVRVLNRTGKVQILRYDYSTETWK